MVLSTAGPWALGGIMVTLGKTSIWYKLAIYFYLHFQYNAWFVLAIIGILIFILEKSRFKIATKPFSKFTYLFHIEILGTFFLSTLWATSHWSVYVLSNIGSLCLWFGLLYLWKSIQKPFKGFYFLLNPQSKFILKFIAFVFLIKLVMQTLSGIPYFAKLNATNLDVVIGYLHWVFLGFISLCLLFLASYLKWIKLSKLSLCLYIIAFLTTEFLIFYRAGVVIFKWDFIPKLNIYLTLSSFLFFLAVLTIVIKTFLFKRIISWIYPCTTK